MSKSVKKTLGVAAAVFAAFTIGPAIASSLSSFLGSLGAGGGVAGGGAAGGLAGAGAGGGAAGGLAGATFPSIAMSPAVTPAVGTAGTLGGAISSVAPSAGSFAANAANVGINLGGNLPAALTPAAVAPAAVAPAAAQPGFLAKLGGGFVDALPQMATQGGLGYMGAKEQEKLVAEQQRQFDIQNAAQQEQFGRQLQAAEEMRAQAAQFDPQRAGLAEANVYQRNLAQREREAMRSMGGQANQARRAAVGRAYDIASATGRGTTYSAGAQQAGAQQLATLQRAAGMAPSVPKRAGLTIGDISSIGDYTGARVKAAGKVLEPLTASLAGEDDKKNATA